MTARNIIPKWSTWGPYVQSVLRVVAVAVAVASRTHDRTTNTHVTKGAIS